MRTRVGTRGFVTSAWCVLLCGQLVRAWEWPALDTAEVHIVKRVIVGCLERSSPRACFAEKITRAVDHTVDWDIPIFDGITLKRNQHHHAPNITSTFGPNSTSRSHAGMDALYESITRFIDAHTLSLDLAEVAFGADRNGDDQDSGTARTIDYGKRKGYKIGKKERRHAQYAMFVLLGIFGLTAPLILKTLGLMAGKALISSKMALIMLGSVALKKIFQPDHSPLKVHTHTIPYNDDGHDRYGYDGAHHYYTTNKYYTQSPLNLV